MQTGIYFEFAIQLYRGVKLGTCSPLVVRFPPQRVAPRFYSSEHQTVLYLIGAPQGPIKKWGNGYLEGENMKRSIVEAIKRAAYLINKIEDYEKEETEQIMRLEDVQRALSEAREEFAEVKELLWVEMRGI